MTQNIKVLNDCYKLYEKNLSKLILILIMIGILILSLIYVPFLILPFASIAWYLLFKPSNRIIVFSAIALLFIVFLFTILEINILIEIASELMYYFLVFILINQLKDFSDLRLELKKPINKQHSNNKTEDI